MGFIITGGTGFIGKHFENAPSLDLRNPIQTSLLEKYETVIHLAGLAHGFYSHEYYKAINVDLALKVASAAHESGVKRFVYLSSANINNYGVSSKHISSKYKLLAEKKLKSLCSQTGMQLVIVRAPLVYGSNSPGNFGLLTKLISKSPILPFGSIANKRDFIAVQNLVDLLIVCSRHPDAPGNIFYASDNETVSTKDFTNLIAAGLAKDVIQLPIPVTLIRLLGKIIGKPAAVEQLVEDYQVDSSSLKNILGWTPPYSMQQAMQLLSKD